jgi:hypothetical protein
MRSDKMMRKIGTALVVLMVIGSAGGLAGSGPALAQKGSTAAGDDMAIPRR